MSSGVTISFPVAERAKFERWINTLSRETQRDVQTVIESALQSTRTRAMRFAPKDMRILSNQINIKRTPDKMGGAVGTDVHYGPYREWGTGRLVKVPAFVKEMFGIDSMAFKGSGKREVNSKGKPYLFESARIAVKELESKLIKMGFKKK